MKGRIARLTHLDPLLRELSNELRENNTNQERAAITEVMALLSALKLTFEEAGNQQSPDRSAYAGQAAPALDANALKRSPYYGMGIGEAARECIKINAREMHAVDIWEELRKSGMQSAHDNPIHAVYDSLRKRQKKLHDVVRLGDGRWGLDNWYSEAQKQAFEGAYRSEKTKEGMQLSAAQGVRIGAPIVFSDEVRAEVEKMIAGGSTVRQAAEAAGISVSLIRKHYRRSDLNALRHGNSEASGQTDDPKIIRHDFGGKS